MLFASDPASPMLQIWKHFRKLNETLYAHYAIVSNFIVVLLYN